MDQGYKGEEMKTKIVLIGILPILLMSLIFHVYGEELKILESQLNKNSITGVLQNPYNFTIGSITVRAEFYDKEDGHLVGVRDFGSVTEDELKPNEKSSYKIPEYAGETESFPKSDFVVKAEGVDMTNMEEVSFEELIGDINNLSSALQSIPNVEIEVAVDENGTRHIVNKTLIYEDNNTNN